MFSKNIFCLLIYSIENETLSKSYRLRPDEFRLVKSISDYCIFLEVNNGPFEDKDTIWK